MSLDREHQQCQRLAGIGNENEIRGGGILNDLEQEVAGHSDMIHRYRCRGTRGNTMHF